MNERTVLMVRHLLFIHCLIFFAATGEGMALEEAKYTVILKEDSFELRQYEPHIVAETVVDGDFDKAGNEGFRRLFKYISGENRKKQSIAMTAPVSQDAGPEKIAMTAPVSQEQAGGQWRIAFVMPSEYTLDTLPQPADPKVSIRQVPARRMAAVRYSGSWSKARYEEHRALLEAFIQKKKLQSLGEPVLARYNSPFALWFLRRNEVLVPVQAIDEERK
jgi:SOUL heme-binding protein